MSRSAGQVEKGVVTHYGCSLNVCPYVFYDVPYEMTEASPGSFMSFAVPCHVVSTGLSDACTLRTRGIMQNTT